MYRRAGRLGRLGRVGEGRRSGIRGVITAGWSCIRQVIQRVILYLLCLLGTILT